MRETNRVANTGALFKSFKYFIGQPPKGGYAGLWLYQLCFPFRKRILCRLKNNKKKLINCIIVKTKKKLKHKARLRSRVSQSGKTYIMIGKVKRVDLPANILDILHERFRVDETSKTGLRWSESSTNQPRCRGKKAGILLNHGYYIIKFNLNKVKYIIGVARIIVMMANNIIIDPALCVNHKNRNTQDNRIANLEVTTASSNSINCCPKGSSIYKNISKRGSSPSFRAAFYFLGRDYRTNYTSSEDHAAVLGWELMTSGKVPLAYVKSQIDEWKDGTYLQRALAECEKQGIAVTPPKFKTLHEYIAFVESEAV